MLRKLLKYDFRANLRIFIFLWPVIIALPLIAHLFVALKIENKLLTSLFTSIFVMYIFGLVGINFFSFYISTRRFYKGLLGKEGYLMFTLPVKPWQLILSKFIVAITTVSVTLIASIVSIIFLVMGLLSVLDVSFDLTLTAAQFDPYESAQSFLQLLLILFSISSTILQIYLACALGHLFKKKRLLWSVIMYFAINLVMQFISSFFAIIMGDSFITADSISITYTLFSLSTTLAICIAFFFLTERILRRNLNLE